MSSNITLKRLHQILQEVMGWRDYHLHQFWVGDRCYGVPELDEYDERDDEFYARLYQVAPAEGSSFTYEYDFGDDWRHEILLERIFPWRETDRRPVCLGGEMATPPEDCGGTFGYQGMLQSIQDPEDPEHDEWLTWLGGSFDPERFDLDEVNRRLKRLRYSSGKSL